MKVSINDSLAGLTFLPNRTPEMGHSAETAKAFAELAKYRDGAIHVGHYSGSSEWERHPQGDELVIVLGGATVLILLINGQEERLALSESELAVVPINTWHRFEDSSNLEVMAVTPEPTDHQLAHPGSRPGSG